jgi:hypothetical protein
MNDLSPTNETIRVTIRRFALGPYLKWNTLALMVCGSTAAAMCTAWYLLAGQLSGKAIFGYFFVILLNYAVAGVIGSLLFAVIYNSLAGRIAGIQLDIVVQKTSATPSRPEGWSGTLPKINDADNSER